MSETIEVKRVRVPNEFLVRFDLHGTPTGAHLVMLSYLQAGDKIMEETIRLEDAVPAEWSRDAVAALLGDYAARLAAELAARQRELDEAYARISELTGGTLPSADSAAQDNGT